MRIAVYGAGAVGSVLAARLSEAGEEVVLIARGRRLQQVREQGVCLLLDGEEKLYRLPVTDDPASLGRQDAVILTVKAHSLPSIAETIGPLLDQNSVLVAAQNGLPWWYNYRVGGTWEGKVLETVDPGGHLWHALPPPQTLGCVLYIAAALTVSGAVKVTQIGNYILGEPDGSQSVRLQHLTDVFNRAGLPTEASSRIRDEIWVKLWGNLSVNMAAVLTGGTVRQMTERTDLVETLRRMMGEAQQIGEALGVRFGLTLDERFQLAKGLGDFKPSSLQDLEVGRSVEVEALLGVVVELGEGLGLKIPTLKTVLSLARLRSELASG